MAFIPKGADAYWHADDDHCPHCGEDGYSTRYPCCLEDLGGEDPDPDAYDDENHAARMAAFAEEVTCE